MRRIEIETAIEKIVADVADDHGLTGASDAITLQSRLASDLGMDEVDLIAIMCRAEDAFGVALPDHRIEPSSTIGDIVTLIADRLAERDAAPARVLRPDVPVAPAMAGVVQAAEDPVTADSVTA